MTADYIAKICEKKLNELDSENSKSIENFNRVTELLHTYLLHNFITFEETELVRKFCKNICDDRIHFENEYRGFGFGCDRERFFNKYFKIWFYD
jgi:hypothetical protein